MKDSSLSEVQRLYSKNFVWGFSDPNADYNLNPMIAEMNYVKKQKGGRLTGFESASYHGTINGYRATLNKNRKISFKQLEEDHKNALK